MIRKTGRHLPIPNAVHPGVVRTHWFLKSLRDIFRTVMVAGGSVFVTLGSMQSLDESRKFPGLWLWLVAAGFFGLLLIGRQTFLKPTYVELSKRLAQAEEDLVLYRSSLQGAIDEIASHLCDYVAGESRADVRVSVYSVEDDEFVLQARYSKNPSLERRGRSSYPLHQGHIGQAWQSGSAVSNFASENRKDWEKELVTTSGFSQEEAAGLAMFSRSLLAKRLDSGREKIGLVVLESEEKDSFDSKALTKLSNSRLLAALTNVVKASHAHLPRAQERRAEREGRDDVRLLPEPDWKAAPVTAKPSA